MVKKKILITGVSGLLGNNLAYYFKEKYKILGIYNSHPVIIKGIQIQKGDITSGNSFGMIIREFSPDIVIHCASLTDVDFCEMNKRLADKINVFGTKVVSDSIKDNVKLIYISTDSVYNGAKGNFSEEDTVNPRNYYGVTKYRGELEVSKRPNFLILRTNFFGWNIQNKYSLAEWIFNELSNNREIKGFKDAYFSSIYTFEFAKILEMAIQKDLTGIYNCASRTSLSKYEFAVELADFFNLNKALIKPISIDDFNFRAKRGKNLSLNISKLIDDLNYRPPTLIESIEAFYRDFKKGMPVRIKQKNIFIRTNLQSNFIPYGRQAIDDSDIVEVVKVLRSDWITQGPKIKEFEDALCKYTGAKYAVVVSSGTAALHIACLAAGIKSGDEVITSPITFVASANCILYCGGKPVFSVVDREMRNIDPDLVLKRISENTRVIAPVDFAGYPADLEELNTIARERGIHVVEDACHALGANYDGEKVGSIS
ncbi:MAG: aminotransferase class I/II-fold pyridoxal phosphate-dependent enzyme, partial [Candidatus Omnitrophica bacterium]|nr:aminotransferase class I/II-fold pyridoxal phosphate-dependent enzyme [Candidatus Omnitrophota bacterium]